MESGGARVRDGGGRIGGVRGAAGPARRAGTGGSGDGAGVSDRGGRSGGDAGRFLHTVAGTEADLALAQARSLARLVAEAEGRVLTQLLGADTARINLTYSLVPNPVRAARAPAAGVSAADPAVPLPDIAAYYRDTRPARLVITGAAPGAGKTVLALLLLLDLNRARSDTDPVPLRYPWPSGTPTSPYVTSSRNGWSTPSTCRGR